MGPNPASSLQFFIPASPNGEGPFHLSEAPLWGACTSVDAARFPEIQQGAGWTQYCPKLRRPQDGAAILTVTFLLGHTPRDTSRDCCLSVDRVLCSSQCDRSARDQGSGLDVLSTPAQAKLPHPSSGQSPPPYLLAPRGKPMGEFWGCLGFFFFFVIKII